MRRAKNSSDRGDGHPPQKSFDPAICLRWIARAGLALAMLGVALELGPADSILLLAPVSFALSPSSITLLLGCSFLLAAIAAERGSRLLWTVGAIVALTLLLLPDFGREGDVAANAGELRVVVWNLSRFDAGWPVISSQLEELAPDLGIFVEHGAGTRVAAARWARAFPEHQACFVSCGLAVISNRGCELQRSEMLPEGSCLAAFDVGAMTVVVADGTSTLNVDRRQFVERVLDYAGEGSPVIAAGDFNTPLRARVMAPIRRELLQPFEGRAGRYRTWPRPLPLLGIDQIFVSRDVRINDARLLDLAGSDHRAILVDLDLTH